MSLPELKSSSSPSINGHHLFTSAITSSSAELPRITSDFHLNNLGKLEYLESNTLNIINYINTNKELKYIYFTFKSGAWLNKEIKITIQSIQNNLISKSLRFGL